MSSQMTNRSLFSTLLAGILAASTASQPLLAASSGPGGPGMAALVCAVPAPDPSSFDAEESSERHRRAIDAMIRHDFQAARRELAGVEERGGDAGAEYLLGLLYQHGLGVEKNAEKAARHLTAAAEASCPQALRALARLAQDRHDLVECARTLHRAALLGDAKSQWLLAGCYFEARGVEKNSLDCLAWAIIATESGSREALQNLEDITNSTPEADRGRVQARVAELRRESEDAKSTGVCSIDLPLAEILGVNSTEGPDRSAGQQAERAYNNKDFATAMRLFLPLAEAGDGISQFYVARMLEKGLGIAVDETGAARWYTLSAKAGVTSAQDNLGLMYLDGRGVRKDPASAADLFQLAAVKGHAGSQLNFGYCHATGTGLQRNCVEAYAWYTLAAEQGEETARSNRRLLEAEMTTGAMAQANVRADEIRDRVRAGSFDARYLPRVPELAAPPAAVVPQSLPAAPVTEPSTRNTPPDSSPEPFSGTWCGTATEQFDDGSTARFPFSLVMAAGPGGVLSADLSADMEATGEDGRALTVRFQGHFSGVPRGGHAELRSDRLELRVVELNQEIPLDQQFILADVQGDTVSGSFGNDVDGWTSFTARKEAARLPRSGVATRGPADWTRPGPATPVREETTRTQPVNPGFAGQGGVIGTMHPIFSSLPGASNLSAPEWMTPGLRITFWSGAASVVGAAGRPTLEEDPNGQWIDENGKRFREGTFGSGSGGAGFTQIDIIEITPTAVVMDLRSYLGDGQVTSPVLHSVTGLISHPSGCDFFVHPRLLAELRPGTWNGMRVMKAPYAVNGSTYDAVLIQLGTRGGASSHYVYDLETGLLLSSGACSTSSSTQTAFDPGSGRYHPGTSTNSMITTNRFIATRRVELPWAGQQMPPWVSQVNGLRFEGEQRVDMNTGMNLPGTGLTCETAIGRRDASFVELNVATSTPPNDFGMAGETTRIVRFAAPTQVGGVWMSPASLSGLQQGTVLDQDPITGYRTVVEFAGRSQNGQSVVVITEAGQTASQQWVYDARSGMTLGAVYTLLYAETQTTSTVELSLTATY